MKNQFSSQSGRIAVIYLARAWEAANDLAVAQIPVDIMVAMGRLILTEYVRVGGDIAVANIRGPAGVDVFCFCYENVNKNHWYFSPASKEMKLIWPEDEEHQDNPRPEFLQLLGLDSLTEEEQEAIHYIP